MGLSPAKKKASTAAKKAAAIALFDLEREAVNGVAALNALVASPPPPTGISQAEIERRNVSDTLRIKLRSLNSYASRLREFRDTLTSAADKVECVAALGEVQAEQGLCQMRLEEITARKPVTDPGASERTNLVNAIAAVAAATKAGAAFLALVGAFRAVVVAYKAKDTVK